MAPLELKVIIVPIMQLAPMATDRTCANVKMDSLVMDLHAQVSVIADASKIKNRFEFSTLRNCIVRITLRL